jgi:hypothetical protein
MGQFGPGLINPFRSWPYVFSNEMESDTNLLKLKDATRISLRYLVIWGATFIMSLIVVFILMLVFSQK